jgi:hypothetical protein
MAENKCLFDTLKSNFINLIIKKPYLHHYAQVMVGVTSQTTGQQVQTME